MTIMNGYNADPDDIAKIVKTDLQGKMQITKLCQNAGISDMDYDNAMVDAFTDSDGYNDTVDTANTTATYNSSEQCYRATETDASESYSTETSTTNTSWTLVKTITLASAKRVEKHVNEVKFDSGVTVGEVCKVEFIYSDSTSSEVIVSNANSGYSTKTYINPNVDKPVTQVKVYLKTPTNTMYERNDQVYAYTYTSGVIQTVSKSFDSNIDSVEVVGKAIIPSETEIKVDVSTDGGATWDATNQDLNTVIKCDGDNNNLVIKIHLNTTNSAKTPRLYGYGVQVW